MTDDGKPLGKAMPCTPVSVADIMGIDVHTMLEGGALFAYALDST